MGGKKSPYIILKRNWVLIGYIPIQNKMFKKIRGKIFKEKLFW